MHPLRVFVVLSVAMLLKPGLVSASPAIAQISPSHLSAQAGGVGRYCSVVYPNGGWQLFWHTHEDPCRLATCLQSSSCRLGSTGTYFLERRNQVAVTCLGFSQTFLGRGDRPLGEAFNTVAKPFQPGCTFQVNNAPAYASGNPGRSQPTASTPSRSTASNPVNPTSAPTGGIAQAMVAAHNQWRSRVGVPPLQWSSQLASYAQEWANQLAASGQFNHRPQRQYGENLFSGSGRQWSPAEVVNDWGSEVKDYDYNTNQCRGVCGHYTQIVWRNTTEVGCGVARSGNSEVWVCNYNPPGNYIGQRPY